MLLHFLPFFLFIVTMRQLEGNRSLILQVYAKLGMEKVMEWGQISDCCMKKRTQMQHNFHQKLQPCGWKFAMSKQTKESFVE